MRLYLIVIFQCILISNLLAQESQNTFLKNNHVSLEFETVLFAGNFSLNYERNFLSEKTQFVQGIKAGFGGWYFVNVGFMGDGYTEDGYLFNINYCMWWSNKFELGFGFSLRTDSYREWIPGTPVDQYIKHVDISFWPIIDIGVRRESYAIRNINYRIYASTWGFGVSLGYVFYTPPLTP